MAVATAHQAVIEGSAESPPGIFRRVLEVVPTGARLSDEAFARRHGVTFWIAAMLATIITGVGVVQEQQLEHVLFEMVPLVFGLSVAKLVRDRTIATLAVVFVLVSTSSLLVHFTGGLIEAHFLFFVLLPLVALYQDWRAFLLAVAYVLFHHGVVGVLAPESVYNHPAAIAQPFKWGLIHALFVSGLIIVLIIEWNFAEGHQRLAESRLNDLHVAQAELVQAQKLESVGQLAAGIAHEINTPMQYIGDNTSFLNATVTRLLGVADAAEKAAAEDATDDDLQQLREVLKKSKLSMLRERAPKAGEDALTGVENVSRIVKAMKNFSHPGSDSCEPLDLNEALNTTIAVARNEWKYRAELVTELSEDLPLIDGKLGPLNQVWLNMIVNATHAIADRHGDEKGLITISTNQVGDSHVEVRIADNGAGISPENVDKVFDHFFTTKEVGKGTGQGLAIAYQVIVGEHGGTVGLESTLGEGTTFVITLPLVQSAAELVNA